MKVEVDGRVVRAGRSITRQLRLWEGQGTNAPARLLDGARGFVEWAHYPQPDMVDPGSGWKLYYHCHVRRDRLRDEHGHLHIFVPAGPAADAAPLYSHLIAISLDRQGLPIRLFTTNRWVTDEIWQTASALRSRLLRPRLRHAEPQDVGNWVENLLTIYREQIDALLVARDRRLADDPRRDPVARQNDFRLRIPSQQRVALLHQLAQIGAAD